MEAGKTIRLGLLGALLLTGCNIKINGDLIPPPLPSARPSGPVVDVVRSPSPTATPTTMRSPGAMDCAKDAPAATPVVGRANQGAYNGQRLPNGWDALASEDELTAAIAKIEGNADWACFQKFFPGAFTVYMGKKGAGTATPRPTPTAMMASPAVAIMPEWFVPPPCRPADTSRVSLGGTVFDEQGVPFPDGVEVRVSTRGFAFNTTVKVMDGRYWVYDAPAGEKLEITAVHEATGEARRRFVTPAAVYDDCGPNGFAVVNFGGPKTADDALGHRYPLPTVESGYERKAETATVTGRVYDIGGNEIDARVTVTSLLAEVPFEATVDTAGGAYVVNDVPPGVPCEIRVEHPSYHARARADVFFPGEGGRKGNVVNFGGDPTLEDPYAPQYALAPVPPETITRPVAVKGHVENIDGDVVTLGVVRARSLEPQVPFEAKAEIRQDGSYSFDAVPGGVEIEFVLEAQGYEPIFRYERLHTDAGVYVNFGGGSEAEDPEGESYALVETIVWDE